MGCGASTEQRECTSPEAEESKWCSLRCDKAWVAELQATDVSYTTVIKLINVGVKKAAHLARLSPALIEGMQLSAVQEMILKDLVAQQVRAAADVIGGKAEGSGKADVTDGGAEPETIKALPEERNEGAVNMDTQGRRKELRKFQNLAIKGLKIGVRFLKVVGPILPVPGPSAAALLATIMDHCGKALANRDNIQRLLDRCSDLLALLAGPQHVNAASEEPQANKAYLNIMTRFEVKLQAIERYCEQYTTRSWLRRIMDGPTDQREYRDFATDIKDMTVEATFGLTVDVHTLSLDVRAKLEKLSQDIMSQLTYNDTSGPLRAFIDTQPGGVDAIMNSEELTQQAISVMALPDKLLASLDRKPHGLIRTVKQVQKEFRKAVESLQASINKGPPGHMNIRHLHLREFWHMYADSSKMEWADWWDRFLEHIIEWEPDRYKELCELLSEEDARVEFQRAIERRDPGTVSVDELRLSFPPDVDLVEQTRKLLHKVQPALAGSSHNMAETNMASGQMTGRCLLPELDAMYYGRAASARDLCMLFTKPSIGLQHGTRTVMLLGSGGLGKSSLALDIGWQLWKGGHLPGGAVLVNLREADQGDQQVQRLCDAFFIAFDDTAQQRLLAHLTSIPASNRLLITLDNAEDCLSGTCAREFAALLEKVVSSAPAVSLLITSRVPWPCTPDIPQLPHYHEHSVQPVDPVALKQLLRQLCPSSVLPDAQLHQTAEACSGSPLLTRLVGDALAAGRMSLEDMEQISTGSNKSSSRSELALVLGALHKQQHHHLARLTVFPYTFDEDDAAAVVGISTDQALALLRALHQHSLLLRDSTCGQHYVHMAVKQQVAAAATPQLLASAREAFVHMMLGRLTMWSALYNTKEFALALSEVRRHATNLNTLWRCVDDELLPHSCLEAVGEAATTHVRWLLQAAGIYAAKPAWGKVEQRHTFASKAGWANVSSLAAYDLQASTEQADKLEKVNAVRSEVLGQEHVSTVLGLHALGNCLHERGQYTVAEPLYRRAMDTLHQVLGPQHPDTITAMVSLSNCLYSMGQHSASTDMDRQALNLRQQVLGDDHPDTIASINNVAVCLETTGQYAAAEPLYRRALELRRAVLGVEHPDAIMSMNNLANCLKSMGQYAEAQPMYCSALELSKHVLGPQHPDTINSIDSLASCLYAMGFYKEAQPMYHNALELRQRILGLDHPDTIASVDSLACCLTALEEYASAQPMHQQAIDMRQQVLGPEHPDTLTSMVNLAVCLTSMGQYSDAEPSLRQILDMRTSILGPEHPDTVSSMHHVAVCLLGLMQFAEADSMFCKVVELRLRLLGPEHPQTLQSIHKRAACLKGMSKHATVCKVNSTVIM